ncbi:hypothetical protein [Neotabrizicola sp. VNH66]|uniref:hypothetical protein n=1 Tax=Neotabrizicola sp. VNH66 TaxID=3400918 RepID=UPI003C10E2EE
MDFPAYQRIWGYVAVVAACASFVAFLLRWGYPQSVRPLSIVAVVVGSVGLLPPAFDVERTGWEMQRQLEERRIHTAEEYLREMSTSFEVSCAPSQRTENSPPDFDEIVRRLAVMCVWSKDLAAKVGGMDFVALDAAPADLLAFYPAPNDLPETFDDNKSALIDAIAKWNFEAAQLKSIRERAKEGVPFWLIIFSPYLQCIALIFAFFAALGPRHPKHV